MFEAEGMVTVDGRGAGNVTVSFAARRSQASAVRA